MLLLLGAVPGASALDADEATLAAWADREFGAALAEGRMTGAAVAVVRGGEPILLRGYGLADARLGTPMDPGQTRVRICSNTKPFVATALMQLVESGAIASLDDPVNRYLRRLEVPDFQGRAVTLRDLVTHRAGFEDSFFNAGTDVRVPTPVSAEVASRLIPQVVREPGRLAVYSNASAAVVGMVIEDLSGMVLRDYLKARIFEPLHMGRTVLNDNPPVPDGSAQPYRILGDGSLLPSSMTAKHPLYAASGGIYSTAADMARFVGAHVAAYDRGDGPVLPAATLQRMHQRSASNHPGLPGIGIQYFVDELNGLSVVSHGCGLPGFSSYQAIVPARHLGLFVSVLSQGPDETEGQRVLRWFGGNGAPPAGPEPVFAAKFYYSFLREFVGFGEPVPTRDLSLGELEPYTGTYRVERRAYSTIMAANDLVNAEAATIVVTTDGDGGLAVGGAPGYKSAGGGLFRRSPHPAHAVAFDDATGRPSHLFRGGAEVATRVQGWQDPIRARYLLRGIILVVATGVLALWWPAASPWARGARWLPLLLLATLAVPPLAVVWLSASGQGLEEQVNVGHAAALWVTAAAGTAAAVVVMTMAIAVAGAFARRHWGAGLRGTLRRLHYLILAGSALLLLPILYEYRLIGFQVP